MTVASVAVVIKNIAVSFITLQRQLIAFVPSVVSLSLPSSQIIDVDNG